MKRTGLFLSIALCWVLAVGSVWPAEAGSYAFVLKAKEYEITEKDNGYQEIQMGDFGRLLAPGKPMLPAKTFMIALPPGAKVSSVRVTGGGLTGLPGTYRIQPAPLQLPRGKVDEEYLRKARENYTKNYTETYSSDNPYPHEVGQYQGTAGMRKWTFVRVSFCPFIYHPKSGRLSVYQSATVVIDYSLPSEGSPEWERVQRLLSDAVMDDMAARLFVNFPEAKGWYIPKPSKEMGCLTGKLDPGCYYVIIVPNDDYVNAVLPLALWKASIGPPADSVAIVATTTIDSLYPGIDLAKKIRCFLRDSYAPLAIRYVLLVGDIADVPMRYCYPDSADHADTARVPTDYYYADLTVPDSLSWDSDGDGYYGEFGQDSVDFVPEVWVGRIPWSDTANVSRICRKIVDFERDMGAWKNWALLLGAITFYDPVKTDEAGLMEDMIADGIFNGWLHWTMYEKGGLDPSIYPCDDSLTHDNVVNEWSTYDYGFVNWSCHGSETGAYRKVLLGGGPTDIEFFFASDAINLDDAHPSIVYASCCENGHPEYYNLGKALLLLGSSSVIAATRPAWGPVTDSVHGDVGGNISINYYFCYYLIPQQRKVGEALFDAKVYYSDHFFTDPEGWHDQQNMFVFNLYGDPALIREGVGVEEEIASTTSSTVLALSQNSPNPFSRLTAIEFSISAPVCATLNIYDVAGRLVRRLVEGKIPAGRHTVKWDGRDSTDRIVSSGVYFYRLEAGNLAATKKMVVLR